MTDNLLQEILEVDDKTLTALRKMYPHHRVLRGSRRPGAPPTERFTVLWREPSAGPSLLASSPERRDARDTRDAPLASGRDLLRREL